MKKQQEPEVNEVIALLKSYVGKTLWGEERFKLINDANELGFEISTDGEKIKITKLNSFIKRHRLDFDIQSCQLVGWYNERTPGFYIKKI